MPRWNWVRHGLYRDSATLMGLTRDLEALPGVARAAVMMGTPHNRDLLRAAGLLAPEGEEAGPTDLIVAVVADSADAAAGARAAAERALAGGAAARGPARPRTLAAALRALPGASLALVSVAGAWAGAEARRALEAGLHVVLFSDNVPLATEVELKRLARARGLLCLGPDCGTAIVAGVPLGFANVVPPGRIGLAAASGTGLQEVLCHLARAGEGISHALGVGGRDLADEVGGLMMEAAVDALAADPATAVIVVVGKPPGPRTRDRLGARLRALGKPGVVCFVGESPAPTDGAGPHVAASLEDAALAAAALAQGRTPAPVEFTLPAPTVARLVQDAARGLGAGQRFVRGVFAGGTLAWEALAILRQRLAPVGEGVRGQGGGHRVVDLGEDTFTVGRPHPMIDGTLRREWIGREARDPATAVLLLDVVLGRGAHADPAGELLPAIVAARAAVAAAGRRLPVVASVCGTEADPQRRSAQVAALEAAGVVVMPSNAQAARLAALIAARAGAPV